MKKALILFLVAIMLLAVPMTASAAYLTDPDPTVTTNGNTTILHKELSGYSNYGAGDKAADILYTGNQGTWTFGAQPGLYAAQFVISGALDDHYAQSAANYKMDVYAGTELVQSETTGFEHGSPYGTKFLNWKVVTVPAGGQVSITIKNTSTGLNSGDWIALDWIELHLVPYNLVGLQSPYAPPDVKLFKAGSTIPLKWQYADPTGAVVDSSSFNPKVSVTPGSCSNNETTEVVVADAGNSGYQYDVLTQTWQFNWQTKGLAAGCYSISVSYPYGDAYASAEFPIQLK